VRPVLLNWGVNNVCGWGIVGLNLFLHWANDPDIRPLLGGRLAENEIAATDPLRVLACQNAILASNQFQPQLQRAQPGSRFNFPVIEGLGNGLAGPEGVRGVPTIARCVFEDTRLAEAEKILAKYDFLVCASHWNAELLRAHVTKRVEIVFEGIDPSLFHPGPKAGFLDPNRFYIFSGGKVEYRKGHDLTLMAFREFSRRHDDAVLVTLWHSPWPQLSAGFQGKLASPLELTREGIIDVRRWAAANGIDPSKVIEIGLIPNPMMPAVLREMDCVLAPSRAEACTNLIAAEAMACGIPVLVAENTGVKDLISPGNSWPLTRQSPIRDYAPSGTEGWGESDVEEIVGGLERLYTDSALRKEIAKKGSNWIVAQDRTWGRHARELKSLITSLA
jgi:glycosyltransferase involved in cell wall biosynthesis